MYKIKMQIGSDFTEIRDKKTAVWSESVPVPEHDLVMCHWKQCFVRCWYVYTTIKYLWLARVSQLWLQGYTVAV